MKQLPNFLPSGYRLHRYCIESVLGSGGFGVTYKAVHEVLPIYYAIKEYLPVELAQRGLDGIGVRPNMLGQMPRGPDKQTWYEWGRERFLDEARTLARIKHPYVARVQDYFADNGTAYIAMDYEEGETLNDLLNRESLLPEDRVRRLLEEVLTALEVVHTKGYLHRDIKPHNLYVRARDGCTMLIDFGSARSILSSYTRTVTSVWSPGYAPPEQYAADADAYGPWTDLYGLGAVLYRCITGERPLDAPSRQMGRSMVPAVKAGAGRYEPGLLAAVDRALALKPEDRFQSVAEMRAALVEERTVPLPPPPQSSAENRIELVEKPIAPPLSPQAGAEEQAASVEEQLPPPSPSRPMLWIDWALAGVLLVLIGGSAALVIKDGDFKYPPSGTEAKPPQEPDRGVQQPEPAPTPAPMPPTVVQPEPAPTPAPMPPVVISDLPSNPEPLPSPEANKSDEAAKKQADRQFWESINDRNPQDLRRYLQDLRRYLEKFPDGFYADLARRRLQKLSQ